MLSRVKQVLKDFGIFLAWNLAVSVAVFGIGLQVSALWALVVVLGLFALLLWGYLLRPEEGSREGRWERLRLRPLEGATWRWTLVAVPVLLTLSWSFSNLYLSVVPVPPDQLNPFEELIETPAQRLVLAVMAVGVAPIVEEFFFRGLIQRTLEERWGPTLGIVGAALLFALVHFLPWVLPLHALLGAAFGFAVYATRSIWSGVVLHAANNSLAIVGLGVQEDSVPMPTLWESGVTAEWVANLAVFLLALTATGWAVRGLWSAGSQVRLSHA